MFLAKVLKPIAEFSKIHLSKTGFSWKRSPTVIKLIPTNSSFVPIIRCSLAFKQLNMPLLTIDISSLKIVLSFFSRALMVFSLSLSSAQYSKPLLAGILKAECNVLPLILKAALPVRAAFTTFSDILLMLHTMHW